VLVDSRYPQQTGAPLGRAQDHSLEPLAWPQLGRAGTVALAHTRMAYHRVTSSANNANQWAVVVSVPAAGSVWSSVLGVGTTAPLIAGLLLLGLAIVGFRTSQRELRTAALHDGLTGLPNRTLLHDRAAQALKNADREHHWAALLLIDLDRFKEDNDTLGHHYGDLLLLQVAARLQGMLREVDTVARLGGDEFAILLPRLTAREDAVTVAAKLLAAFGEPFIVERVTLDVEASIGVNRPGFGETRAVGSGHGGLAQLTVVGGLQFCRWEVADLAVEPAVVYQST
jgi:diguanylate cyclase (GGDEF)-like protein